MQDELVTFDTAVLAKEAGFDILTYHYYQEEDSFYKEDLITPKETLLVNDDWPYNVWSAQLNAPTQSLLQRWLREIHKIVIEISYEHELYYCYLEYKPCDTRPDLLSGWVDNFLKNPKDTYEECLEMGLQEALKIVIAEQKLKETT
jgi:hypothetical protein